MGFKWCQIMIVWSNQWSGPDIQSRGSFYPATLFLTALPCFVFHVTPLIHCTSRVWGLRFFTYLSSHLVRGTSSSGFALELEAVETVCLVLMNDLALEYCCLDWAHLEINEQLWSCQFDRTAWDQGRPDLTNVSAYSDKATVWDYSTTRRKRRFDNQQVSIKISKDHYSSPNHLPSALFTSRDQRRKTGNQDNLKRESTRGGSRHNPFNQTILTSMPRQYLTCFVYARRSSIHQRSTKKK